MVDEAPPLRLWIFPILAVLTIVLSFLYYCYSDNGPYAKVVALSNKNLENALIENTRDTSALSIVILGSSLTEYAFADPRGLADSIFKQTNKKTKVLRVALNFMDMSIAERIDFFDYITNYPPNYLFVENFSFNLENGDTTAAIPEPVNMVRLQIRNYIRNAIGMATEDNYYRKWYTFDVKPLPGDYFYTDKFDSVTFKALLQAKKSSVRKVTQNGVANSAYEALTKRNSKVIFLDFPMRNQLVDTFMDDGSTSELNKTLQYYKNQYRIDYWQFPYMMDSSCFIDGAHLNSKGAMQYQKWFVSEIASKRMI
ncbi:MAG TPA: hypothetical protein VFD46_06490 [Chryseolinea sp.]|nr:hypothetical protein [Chryseolinea sp.]